MPKPSTPEQFLHRTNNNRQKHPLVQGAAKVAERKTGRRYGNAEQKIGAFIGRMARIEHESGRVKERLLDAFIEGALITEENIPDAYWEQQRKLFRDNGQGIIQLDKTGRSHHVAELQNEQYQSLYDWIEHFEESYEYPMWFKVYAMEGVLKLGTFDRKKGRYGHRTAGTVAPFPPLNPGAVARVYDMIGEGLAGIENEDEGISQLVTNGSFNKLYSHCVLEANTTVPTPDNAEDVMGEWREYNLDDINELTRAAQGTPWCVAQRGEAREYFRRGSSFHFFHLKDPNTGEYSDTASASIRLVEGEVVEVSGLDGGPSQFLEGSLVATVNEKIRTLPGDSSYLRGLKDQQVLIAMDRKYEAGRPFTPEEIVFLYEMDGPIHYMNGASMDPRPTDFRKGLAEHVETLRAVGIETDATALVSRLDCDYLVENIQFLKLSGVDVNLLITQFSPAQIAVNIDVLVEAGVPIDVDAMVEAVDEWDVVAYLGNFIRAGADHKILISRLDPEYIGRDFSQLMEAGLSYYELTSHMAAMKNTTLSDKPKPKIIGI